VNAMRFHHWAARALSLRTARIRGKGSVGQTTLVMLGVGLVAVAAVILSTFVMRKSPATPDEGIFKLISRITLDPRTICQPRDGEILFQILFPGYIGTNSNVSAYFRWWTKNDDQDWVRTPSIRLTSMDTRLGSLTLAVTVPRLPPAPRHVLTGLWPIAEVWISVRESGSDVALGNYVARVGISNRLMTAAFALSVVFVILGLLIAFNRRNERSVEFLKPVSGPDRRVTLSRFQTVLWSVVIAGTFTYFVGLTGYLGVPPSVLIVLGIIGTTEIASQLFAAERFPVEESQGTQTQPSFYDLVRSGEQLSFAKVQLFAVTVLTATVFVANAAVDSIMPPIPAIIQVLLGVSSFLYLVANTPTLTKKLGEEIIRDVRALLLGPEATRYSGFARVTFEPNAGGNADPYIGKLSFSTDVQPADGWARIDIAEGRLASQVTFSVIIRSDDPTLPEIDRDLIVPVKGRHEMSFGVAPKGPGVRHFWVTILQANRMVQIIEAQLPIKGAAASPDEVLS
jgi:hypothetical protein